jgi:hypothetical protein
MRSEKLFIAPDIWGFTEILSIAPDIWGFIET